MTKMDKVGFQIINTPNGLHSGHRAIINFGKQFGKVEVNIVEDVLNRNRYLETGLGTPKYKVNLEKLDTDCKKLDARVGKPTYISISEEKRISLYNRMSSFVNTYRDFLLAERYIKQAICSLMIVPLTDPKDYNLIIFGPEVLGFFYKRVGLLLNNLEGKIYPNIVRNEHGLKMSSTNQVVPFDIKRLRKVIDGAKDRYKVGDNKKLVEELNYCYPKSIGWRVKDILVYEGGFVDGRIEVTSFTYIGPFGIHLLEEVDYCA